jgi:hypothetical protein
MVPTGNKNIFWLHLEPTVAVTVCDICSFCRSARYTKVIRKLMATLFQNEQNLFLSSSTTLQTSCYTFGRCLTPFLASLLDISVIACPTVGSYPEMFPHSQHVPHQLLWVASWLPVCVRYFPSHLQRHAPLGNSGIWQSLFTTSCLYSFVTLLCISFILMNQHCSYFLNMFLGHLQVTDDDWHHKGHLKQIADSYILADTWNKSLCF